MPFGDAPDPDPKVQAVRALDVVVLGPAMIYLSSQAHAVHPVVRWFVGIAGATTMLFNGVNFVRAARTDSR